MVPKHQTGMSGERLLAWFALIDGMHIAMGKRLPAHSPCGDESERQRELKWILSEDTYHPFAFECLCAMFNLDASAVRRFVVESLRLQPARKRRLRRIAA